MREQTFACLTILAMVVAAGGCGPSPDAETENAKTKLDSKYFLSSEPENVLAVGKARTEVKDGDAVALTGLIGGQKEPFVAGVAAFTIIDSSMEYCPPEEGCPTPWDYCCYPTDEIAAQSAVVKFVTDAGDPVMQDARELLGVKELTEVVVQGVAVRDEAGNLSLLASKILIK